MKPYQTKNKSFLLVVILMTLLAGRAFPQGANNYDVCIRNVHHVSDKVIEFDVWLEWSGTNTQKLQAFQGGLDFNYAGLANGGNIQGAFVPGSADPSLPAVQQNPNWNINPDSKQIRFLAAVATPATVAVATPAPPGFRLGTMRLTNTLPFTANAPMNFTWSFHTGTNLTTQSRELFYLNGKSTGTAFLDAKASTRSSMKVADGGGCRLSTNNEVEKLSKLMAYPNPTTGNIKVTFNSEVKSKFNLIVTDMLGKVAMNETLYAVTGENTKEINLSKLTKGMYFLSLEADNSNVQSVVPIVVE